MIKAIIFDAYGTIISTGTGSIDAAKQILKKCNSNIDPVEFYSKWKSYHRDHIDNITYFIKEEEIFLMDLERLYYDYNLSGNAKEDVKIMLSTLGNRHVYPDTISTLRELRKKYKIFIGSTTDEAPLLSDIKQNKIIVDGYFTSESLKAYKPQKEFFVKILSEIGLNSDEVIYVGDSFIDDITGASNAGIKSIWVNRKNQILDSMKFKPYYEITSLYKLLEVL